ncbi:MAG: hypothetical protein P8P30_11060 [Rickettsiales bacterium]|nr:hypothetical protein [Rickettsiales bacterium]
MPVTLEAEISIYEILDKTAKLGNVSFQNFFFYRSNKTRNDYYQYAIDLIKLSQQPAHQYLSHREKFADVYVPKDKSLSKTIMRNWDNLVGGLVLEGVYVGEVLLESRHNYVAFSTLLKVLVTAKAKSIATAGLPAFLADPSTLKNPITGQPFTFDATHKTACYQRLSGDVDCIAY